MHNVYWGSENVPITQGNYHVLAILMSTAYVQQPTPKHDRAWTKKYYTSPQQLGWFMWKEIINKQKVQMFECLTFKVESLVQSLQIDPCGGFLSRQGCLGACSGDNEEHWVEQETVVAKTTEEVDPWELCSLYQMFSQDLDK